jgi:flagellar FliJ protein
MDNTLESLIEFAKGERDEALGLLSAALAQSRDAKGRLELLVRYRAEYAERMTQSASNGTVSAEQLRNFGAFLEKLERAIAQQQAAAAAQDEQVHTQRELWREREAQLAGYSQLKARRDAAENLRDRRAEQRQTDEHAGRMFLARVAGGY